MQNGSLQTQKAQRVSNKFEPTRTECRNYHVPDIVMISLVTLERVWAANASTGLGYDHLTTYSKIAMKQSIMVEFQ